MEKPWPQVDEVIDRLDDSGKIHFPPGEGSL